MNKVLEFGYFQGEAIDLNHLDSVEDKVLFRYEEEISDMIINGIDAGEQDFLEECRNEIMDEIKRRYFDRKSLVNKTGKMGSTEYLDVKRQTTNKINVLKDVKELTLLPNTVLMTTKMVAEWYEVGQATMRKIVERYKQELVEKGMQFKSYSEIKDIINMSPRCLGISPKGSNLFTPESVILLCFYLKKSKVSLKLKEEVMKYPSLQIEYKDKFLNIHNGLSKENYIYDILRDSFNGIYIVERSVKCGQYFIDFTINNGNKKLQLNVMSMDI